MKLSPTQQKVIDHLKETGTFLHYMRPWSPDEAPYYFFSDNMKHVRWDTVERLIKLDLLVSVNGPERNWGERDKKVYLKATKTTEDK
jgi:hypothetical protein